MDYSKILGKYYSEHAWICGETYESLRWLDDTLPKPTEEELELKYDDLQIDEMREQRNRLLRDSDHCALPDFPQREAWLAYRQELRDFPSVWLPEMPFPQKPE
jgi:hypothetical protein